MVDVTRAKKVRKQSAARARAAKRARTNVADAAVERDDDSVTCRAVCVDDRVSVAPRSRRKKNIVRITNEDGFTSGLAPMVCEAVFGCVCARAPAASRRLRVEDERACCAERESRREEARALGHAAYVCGLRYGACASSNDSRFFLRIAYPAGRGLGERVVQVGMRDFSLGRGFGIMGRGRTKLPTRTETRFRICRDAMVRYLNEESLLARYAASTSNDETMRCLRFFRTVAESQEKFLVVGYNPRADVWPLTPFMLVHADDDAEDLMPGELVRRLEAATTDESWNALWLPNVACAPCDETENEGQARTRVRFPLPPSTRNMHELCSGSTEVSVTLANSFPSMTVTAYEKYADVVCERAWAHKRVVVLRIDLRLLDYLCTSVSMFVWASPPCTAYTNMRQLDFHKRKSEDLEAGTAYERSVFEHADALVNVTLDFIACVRARAWIIENPHARLIKRIKEIWHKEKYVVLTTSYCKYNMPYRKTTDFFMSVDLARVLLARGGLKPPCTPSCPCDSTNRVNVRLKNGKQSMKHIGQVQGRKSREVARIPPALLRHIIRNGLEPFLAERYGVAR